MNIVLLGTGNVGVVLGKLFVRAGHEIKQVYGRNETEAKRISALFSTESTNNLHEVVQDADLYVIAVSDSAISSIASTLININALVVHTSGGISINALDNCKRYGVLYPLQSLRKEMEQLPEIPFFVDAPNERDLAFLKDFAATLSNKVYKATDDERLKLHIGAVVCSNFTNHLYALTQDFCEKSNIDFSNYLPLIQQTTQRLQYYKAADVQTGPAARNDTQTIERHLEALKAYPEIFSLYKVLSQSITNKYAQKTPLENQQGHYEQATDLNNN